MAEQPFQFPASNLDQPGKLLAALGSFWATTFQDADDVQSFLAARAKLDSQNFLGFLELLAAMSRFTVPIFHTQNWYDLRLLESDRNTTDLNLPAYNAAFQYAESGDILYGTPVRTPLSIWKLPADLADAPLVLNRITAASVVLTESVDYFIRDGVIAFRANPFDNELVAVREVFSDNAVVNRECSLWVYRGQWDLETIYRQFGYALGIHLQSSGRYRDFVNAIYDGLVVGTTESSLKRCVAAICDVPLALGNETVESIFSDARQRWVVTDKNAYGLHLNANVVVNVHDVLQPGQSLSDAVEWFEFGRGQVPNVDDVRALAVGQNFLATGFVGDLVFENKTVPLLVTENVNGYTKVSFALGGFDLDVENFWDEVHTAGVAKNQTLAMLLDQRPASARSTQPTALALPATVNPLGFLLQNVFRANVMVVRLRTSTFGPQALGLENLTYLRKLIAPHTALIFLIELTVPADTILMDGEGSETAAGYAESVSTYAGMAISETMEPADFSTERVRAYQIKGRCE